MSRISVGVIGLGRMGRMHARVFSEIPDRFELVGTFDALDREAGSRAGSFASAAALIECSELVIVATPTPQHGAIVCAALERGRAVLVEKPSASTAFEARQLAAFAESRQCPLFVGHSERFNPVARAMRERWNDVANTGTGMIDIAIERFVPQTVAAGAGLAGDDVLLNLGVHDLDLVEHLTGTRVVVLGATGDASSSRLHLTAGPAFVTLRCGREGERKRLVRVTTESAVFEGDLLSPRLLVTDRLAKHTRAVELSSEEALRGQALAVHAALTRAPSEVATGVDGARAVELAELAIALRDRRRPAIAVESAQT